MFKKLFIVFMMLVGNTFAGFNCREANTCQVFCKNFRQSHINLLKKTNWIAVPWDNGNCYFHNKVTKEDTDNYPLKVLTKKY